MKDSKVFWNNSAEKYAKSAIKDEASYQKKLAITQEYLNADNYILEFGCGSGSTALRHAPYVQHILATDISDKMIEIAQRRAIKDGIENISFQQGVLDELNIQDQSFDAVLGLNVLHLLKDVDGSINTVHSLLKNNGVFISSTSLIGEVNIVFHWLISAMQFIGLAPYVARFTKKQLINKLIKAGFYIEREWQTSHESVFIVAKKVSEIQVIE